MKVEFAALTHPGNVRPRNEDAYGIMPRVAQGVSDELRFLLAVADGMGGHPGGDLASSLAVRAAMELERPDEEAGPAGLSRACLRAIRKVGEAAGEDPKMAEMGTTLTLLGLDAGLGWVAHVGDTRLYWRRAGQWLQVTRDHTVAQDLVEAGVLERDAADSHPSSHVLTRCIGVCRDNAPDLLTAPLWLQPGDLFLLCTDGLVKVIREREFDSIMGDHAIVQSAERLVQACRDGGAPDNVTVMLVRILDPGRRAPRGNAVEPEDGPAALSWEKVV